MKKNVITIGVFIYDQVILSTAIGLCDIFNSANMLASKNNLNAVHTPTFNICTLSWDGLEISAANGLTFTPQKSLKTCRKLDILIFPGMINSADVKENKLISKKIKSLHNSNTLICSVCAGAFYLASAGILNGIRATSHWNLIADYKKLFPKVHWVPNNLLVIEESVITSGGVSSYQELALHLIAQYHSPLLVKYVSSFLLIEPNRNIQTPYEMTLLPLAHSDAEILDLQNWIQIHYGEPIDQKFMAYKVKMSERTFMRRFKKSTGYTPLEYIQEVRLLQTKEQLEHSTHTFEHITTTVGYSDVSSFRKLFIKRVGIPPSEYRTRFSNKNY